MKKLLLLFFSLLTISSCSATENDEPQLAPAENGTYFNGKKVLVAYFSWGGTTRRMAEAIPDSNIGATEYYDLQGRRSSAENAKNGIYVVVAGDKTSKVFIR